MIEGDDLLKVTQRPEKGNPKMRVSRKHYGQGSSAYEGDAASKKGVNGRMTKQGQQQKKHLESKKGCEQSMNLQGGGKK